MVLFINAKAAMGDGLGASRWRMGKEGSTSMAKHRRRQKTSYELLNESTKRGAWSPPSLKQWGCISQSGSRFTRRAGISNRGPCLLIEKQFVSISVQDWEPSNCKN